MLIKMPIPLIRMSCLKMKIFKKDWHSQLLDSIRIYFTKLQPIQQYPQRYAFAAMFLSRKKGNAEFNCQQLNYEFTDLGLVYQCRKDFSVQYYPLCPAVKNALIDLYKGMPLPRDAQIALASV